MKIERKPAAAFAGVASALAKDKPPPEWLVPMLVHYSPLVGARRNPDEADDKKMIKAARELEGMLAIYGMVEDQFGFELPEEVDTASLALHELIEYLESELRPPRKGGPTPDSRYRLCAWVCGEVWRRERGELQPYSRNLWEACEKYWQACGQPATSAKGNLDNWQERLEWVRDTDPVDLERLIARLPTS
jgi:hypothetical protein